MKYQAALAAALCFAAAMNASAQDTTKVKDSSKVVISNGAVEDTITIEWYLPGATTCSSVDVSAAKAVQIKSDKYDASAGMISPDSAKVLALCAVPGQIGSGEMEMNSGRMAYAIDIIPNDKKTHAKVIVDAKTGAVLSSKQFGGLRGLAGWVRESAEHKMNTNKPPTDTTAKKPPTDSTAAKPAAPAAKPPVTKL